jgi:hypothetical protein
MASLMDDREILSAAYFEGREAFRKGVCYFEGN